MTSSTTLVAATVHHHSGLQGVRGAGGGCGPRSAVHPGSLGQRRPGRGRRPGEVRVQDIFDTDIRPATVVTLFLSPEVNARLRPKLTSPAAGSCPTATVSPTEYARRLAPRWSPRSATTSSSGACQGAGSLDRGSPLADPAIPGQARRLLYATVVRPAGLCQPRHPRPPRSRAARPPR